MTQILMTKGRRGNPYLPHPTLLLACITPEFPQTMRGDGHVLPTQKTFRPELTGITNNDIGLHTKTLHEPTHPKFSSPRNSYMHDKLANETG
jgi:hypothetical protein